MRKKEGEEMSISREERRNRGVELEEWRRIELGKKES